MTKRKLIIEGNAVYELDEDCMLRKKMNEEKTKTENEEAFREIERYKSRMENRRE